MGVGMSELTDDDLKNISFAWADRVHDWRNHVGEKVKAIWQSFTPEQRRAIYEDAEECAASEDWD